MKRLLMTAAALLALTAPALAGNTIPADFHGEWCSLNDTYYVQRSVVDLYRKQDVSEKKCSRDSNGWVKITANRYDNWKQDCKPVNVTKLPYNGIAVKLRCAVEEGAENFDLTVELSRTPGSGSGSWIKRLYIEEKQR
jgi:hypothetical protein